MPSVNSPNHHKNLHAGVKCNAYDPYSAKIHAKIKEKLFIECTSENVVTMPTPFPTEVSYRLIWILMRWEVIDVTKQYFRHVCEIHLCFKSCSTVFSWFSWNISFRGWLLGKDPERSCTCNIYCQKLRFFQNCYKIQYKLERRAQYSDLPIPGGGGGSNPLYTPIFQIFYKGK